MIIAELIEALEQFPSENEVRFVEHQDGKTIRWQLSIACNLEYQAEIGQLWFTRCQNILPETD